uniref:Uncharacterized protein n=1 Tax=Lactuca sativa TaxID=4236 RepID=A0A9R1UT74_LACSA|nr:hypothetical protein LSAT_V11C800430060 [Lactuca sativa]
MGRGDDFHLRSTHRFTRLQTIVVDNPLFMLTFVEEQKEGKKMRLNRCRRKSFLPFVLSVGFEIESEQRANTLVTFCTCISLTSVGLMLTITVPYVGDNQFPFIVFSPLVQSETRNWNNGGYSVRMLVAEYMTLSEIVVQRDDQQVE